MLRERRGPTGPYNRDEITVWRSAGWPIRHATRPATSSACPDSTGMHIAEPLPERSPELGELVQVRSRRWLVEKVTAADGASPVVRLACADDDAQGEELEVLWDYEPDRRILEEERWDHLAARGFDDPGRFAAFLDTLRWNTVTATD